MASKYHFHIIRYLQIDSKLKLVLLVLSAASSKNGDRIYQSMETIAFAACLNLRTAQRRMANLIAEGWVLRDGAAQKLGVSNKWRHIPFALQPGPGQVAAHKLNHAKLERALNQHPNVNLPTTPEALKRPASPDATVDTDNACSATSPSKQTTKKSCTDDKPQRGTRHSCVTQYRDILNKDSAGESVPDIDCLRRTFEDPKSLRDPLCRAAVDGCTLVFANESDQACALELLSPATLRRFGFQETRVMRSQAPSDRVPARDDDEPAAIAALRQHRQVKQSLAGATLRGRTLITRHHHQADTIRVSVSPRELRRLGIDEVRGHLPEDE